MKTDELIDIARTAAVIHGLAPELVCAICEQESGWNPWAVRYEPAFYERYISPLADSRAVTPTEASARAFSWGLMQVMGQVAREQGFAGSMLAELCEPKVGLEIGCSVLARKLALAKGDVARALLLWNGGSDKEYSAEVIARMEKYR
jgi:soluble lytic murein transglycosylase-like protein